MKNICIWSMVIISTLFHGCNSSNNPIPKPLSYKNITIVFDTIPSGADIYEQTRGGAWIKSPEQTPLRLSLVLKFPSSNPFAGIETVNGLNISQYEQTYTNSLGKTYYSLGNGIRYVQLQKMGDNLIVPLCRFQKSGYLTFPHEHHRFEDISLTRLWLYNKPEYKYTYPMKRIPYVEPPVQQTVKGYMLNLRIVAIPSGKIIGGSSGSAHAKADIPDMINKLCNDLEPVWRGRSNPRVSIVGIAEIDIQTKQRESGIFITECLYTALANRGSMILLERSQVAQFLNEHNLTIENIVDNPKSLEKMEGIDYVILGSVFWTRE